MGVDADAGVGVGSDFEGRDCVGVVLVLTLHSTPLHIYRLTGSHVVICAGVSFAT